MSGGARKPPCLAIAIDRLVLRGFAPGTQAVVARAFAAELRRLATMPGPSLGDSRTAARLRLRPVQLDPGAGPQAIAPAAARRLMVGRRP